MDVKHKVVVTVATDRMTPSCTWWENLVGATLLMGKVLRKRIYMKYVPGQQVIEIRGVLFFNKALKEAFAPLGPYKIIREESEK